MQLSERHSIGWHVLFNAECSCPIFWGIFQLTGADAQCILGDDLVWSASYVPTLDVRPWGPDSHFP
jgi:hypothetical protein